jgi:hypothetical protein
MKIKEQNELELSLTNLLKGMKEKLFDSPMSLDLYLSHSEGFYHGFCQGKGWEADTKILKVWNELC